VHPAQRAIAHVIDAISEILLMKLAHI
jgi:hypothetical protein